MLGRKALAFVRRDLLIESSYKFAFVLELLASVFPVVSLYFVGKLVGGQGAQSLERYGGQYFPFAMVGIAVTQYFTLALATFANTIRRSQMAGCLEAMLNTRTAPQTLVILSSLYSFVAKTVHVALVFLVGTVWLGADLSRANWGGAGVVLILTILTFSSLGIFSAALIVVLKKGDPIEWIFGSVSALVGGALFPVAVMPAWMQTLATLLPITYSLDGMRLAVLQGAPLAALWKEIAVLAAMAAVLLPVSVLAFSRAVEKGRRDGSLMHY